MSVTNPQTVTLTGEQADLVAKLIPLWAAAGMVRRTLTIDETVTAREREFLDDLFVKVDALITHGTARTRDALAALANVVSSG